MVSVVANAPGKLMIAGEWAVLELCNPCVVMALDKGITVRVSASDATTIKAPDVGPHDKFEFANQAIKVAVEYLCEQYIKFKTFSLTITSEISTIRLPDGTVAKAGMGSSAATVVSVIRGVLQFHEFSVDNEIIFKLACIAHYQAQGNMGSCFDIAASAYGGILVYRRFDPCWLQEQLASSRLHDIVAKRWPYLSIKRLEFPRDIAIKPVFSGLSANTRVLMQKMHKFKAQHKKLYDEICDAIAEVVNELVDAIEKKDHDKILSCIKQNRKLLQKLSDASGLNLETPELKKICDKAQVQGFAAKFSGAGGGDCAIVVFKTA